MNRWIGKIALVTGANSGVGYSVAEELCKTGLKVFGLDKNIEKIKELSKNLKGEIIPLKADVSVESDILSAFKEIKEKFGKIHVLVNNAGIMRIATISGGNTKFFKDTFDVNVMGTTICTQQALKLMKEAGVDDGHIININSIEGHKVINHGLNINVYAASKHAITALTESLRQELVFLKSKIRVTSISPGFVETNILPHSAAASGIPVEKFSGGDSQSVPILKPKDIADAILYVLSTPPHVQIHELTIKPVGETF